MMLYTKTLNEAASAEKVWYWFILKFYRSKEDGCPGMDVDVFLVQCPLSAFIVFSLFSKICLLFCDGCTFLLEKTVIGFCSYREKLKSTGNFSEDVI